MSMKFQKGTLKVRDWNSVDDAGNPVYSDIYIATPGLDVNLTDSDRAAQAKATGDRIKALETSIAEITSAIESLKSSIDTLNGTCTSINDTIVSMQEDIQNLKAKISSI